MSVAEKIKIMLIKRGDLSVSELARRLKTSPQNFHDKLKRNNFSERDMEAIAKALDCSVSITFTMNDTGETV